MQALRDDVASLSSKVATGLADVRGDIASVRGDIASVRGEMRAGFAELRVDMQKMHSRNKKRHFLAALTMAVTVISACGFLFATLRDRLPAPVTPAAATSPIIINVLGGSEMPPAAK